MSSDAARHRREAEHYDLVATGAAGLGGLEPEALAVGRGDLADPSVEWLPFMGLPAFTAELLGMLGPLDGRRVLDLGSGTGFLSIALAHRGARVESIDISPASMVLARARAEASGVADRIGFHVGSAESLPFASGAFDAACGLFVLHHTDLGRSVSELVRVLRPGAPAAFVETLGLNPLLAAARAALPGRFGIEKASTDDERPLDTAALRTIGEIVGTPVAVGCPEVVFARMGAYLPPLQAPLARGALARVDRALGAIGPLRRLSYFGLVSFRTPGAVR